MSLTISKRPVEPEFNSYVLYRDPASVFLLVVYDLYLSVVIVVISFIRFPLFFFFHLSYAAINIC